METNRVEKYLQTVVTRANAGRIEGRAWINLILVSWKCYMLFCLNASHLTPHDLRFTEINHY